MHLIPQSWPHFHILVSVFPLVGLIFVLGLYVSDHPLMGVEHALRRLVECSIADLNELEDGSMRTVAGVVTALQRKYTKRGDLMAKVKITVPKKLSDKERKLIQELASLEKVSI